MTTWLTNSSDAARKLRAADKAFDRAMAAAANLKLADKVIAIREAKAARQAAYDAVGAE